MRTPRPSRVRAFSAAVLLALASGCSSVDKPSRPPTQSPGASPTLGPGEPTPVPTDPDATPAATIPTQTDTDWGRIWDGLPTTFPAYPGARPTETGEGPASAILDAGAVEPAEVAAFYESALEVEGLGVVSSSGPREDGSWEVEAVGDAGCGIRVTVTPLGGSTVVTILYGAACRFS